MESYIDRIKLMKSRKKMTNEQLAEKSGIPLGTLSKIMAGMSDSPKVASIVAICGALDCSVEYIVTGTPENNQVRPTLYILKCSFSRPLSCNNFKRLFFR